jgi:probable rRNA maturation factor
MIQRRSVATAGIAFASHFCQAWNVPVLTNHATKTLQQQLLAAKYPQQKHQSPHPLWGSRSHCYSRCSNHRNCKAVTQYIESYYSYAGSRFVFSKTRRRLSRLFGSKSGSGIPGTILIQDDQKAIVNIDLNRLQQTAFEIRKHLAASKNGNDYDTYDISIFLIDDKAMQEANYDSRKINKPTDILSFQFHDAIAPGELDKPLLDVADYYNLGDILIDVPYVIRSCQDDQSETNSESSVEKNDGVEQDSEEEEEEEEEVWVDDDRGVSGAMSKVFDPELRINMLLIHGMLHLVGYDHEDDEDYEIMVKKEEEILEILQRNGILKLPTAQP